MTAFNGSLFGAGGGLLFRQLALGGASTYAMAALNTGWCARFMAQSTADITGVVVRWGTVTAAGTVQVRIETIDMTSGKPTGTLYDANASLSFTPVAGNQTLTFATPPSTGLTEGNWYGVVLLTTAAGTAHTLASHLGIGRQGTCVMTAADGTTRTNFGALAPSTPMASLVLEDATEVSWGMTPYTSVSALTDLYGADRAAACKFTLLSSQTFDGIGVYLNRAGTPVGAVRARILDASNNLVTGASVTHDIDLLAPGATRDADFWFNDPITLTAGTYRIVIDSTASASSSHCWRVPSYDLWSATAAGAQFLLSTTADMSTTFTWSDDTDSVPAIVLFHSTDVAASGGRPEFRGATL